MIPAPASLWALPVSEGCSPCYLRVDSVAKGAVVASFIIAERDGAAVSRYYEPLGQFQRRVERGSYTPAAQVGR